MLFNPMLSSAACATYLQQVSLTGPDDAVDPEALRPLGQRFPFVEWALLYMPTAEGRPRNPTRAWRERFFDSEIPGSSAVHLCGEQAFDELLAGALPSDIRRACRLQLNVNARGAVRNVDQVIDIYRAALDLGPSLILQYHEGTAEAIGQWLAELGLRDRFRVHVLLDGSKGRGVLPEQWTLPAELAGTYTGFAGGLGPMNVPGVLNELEALRRPYWIDMETGIRSENAFDLAKAEAVLQAAAHLEPRPWKCAED